MDDNKFKFETLDDSKFSTEGRSSVKIKLTSKGQPSVEVKIYAGTTPDERETIYQAACEIIDRLKMRYFNLLCINIGFI